jgi:hypothetical protein
MSQDKLALKLTRLCIIQDGEIAFVTETNNNNNNDVTVRFTYDKRTIIDEGHGSPKAVMEVFYFYSKNNTLSYSYEQFPLGQRDGESDRMYKTLKHLSDSDAKNLIDTIDSAITQADKSGHQTYSTSKGMDKS